MTDQGKALRDGFGRRISRRDFLKVGGAGLTAGAMKG